MMPLSRMADTLRVRDSVRTIEMRLK